VDARPIGVFDSGIGGLSILQALRAELPQERCVYVADSGHAPYGERDAAHVIARSQAIATHLVQRHGVKLLVVACNTATAAAIELLRQEWPELPIVGVEPALKPAARLSRTGRVGVLATRGTLASAKFQALLASLQDQAHFALQPCDGLADAIERQDLPAIDALAARYIAALSAGAGEPPGAIDTLVLGCTHYPLARAQLQALAGPAVTLIDSGAPVAQQARRLLQAGPGLAPPGPGRVELLSSGHPERLQAMARAALGLQAPVLALPD
jgi:glutamate racemase